ncbi:MAG: branched-chain amino acid aminotransferase, partial [Planctomycetota bacterium]
MQDSQSAAWLNGRWVTARDLFVPMNDPGFRQGVTAVERLRTYQGRLFQLREHFDRFLQTADALHIAGIPSFDDWSGIAESVLR